MDLPDACREKAVPVSTDIERSGPTLTRSQVATVVKAGMAPELKALGFTHSRMTLPGWTWVASNNADAIGVWYQVTTFARAYYLESLGGGRSMPCVVRVEVGPTRQGDDMYEQATVRGASNLPKQLAEERRVELERLSFDIASAAWADIHGGASPDELESIQMATSGNSPFFPIPDKRAADLWKELVAPEVLRLAARWQEETRRR